MKVTNSKEIIERNGQNNIGHPKQVLLLQAHALLILQWHHQNY